MLGWAIVILVAILVVVSWSGHKKAVNAERARSAALERDLLAAQKVAMSFQADKAKVADKEIAELKAKLANAEKEARQRAESSARAEFERLTATRVQPAAQANPCVVTNVVEHRHQVDVSVGLGTLPRVSRVVATTQVVCQATKPVEPSAVAPPKPAKHAMKEEIVPTELPPTAYPRVGDNALEERILQLQDHLRRNASVLAEHIADRENIMGMLANSPSNDEGTERWRRARVRELNDQIARRKSIHDATEKARIALMGQYYATAVNE